MQAGVHGAGSELGGDQWQQPAGTSGSGTSPMSQAMWAQMCNILSKKMSRVDAQKVGACNIVSKKMSRRYAQKWGFPRVRTYFSTAVTQHFGW